MNSLTILALHLGLVIWLGACAVLDGRYREVSNWLTLPALLLGIAYSLTQGWNALLQVVVAGIIFVLVWLFGGMGGADVKVILTLLCLWPLSFVSGLVLSVLWAVGVWIKNGRRKTYPGIPPLAVGAGLALVWEGFLFFK